MAGALLKAVAFMGATLGLAAGVNQLKNANDSIQRDPTAALTPESMQPQVDTRAPQRDVQMIQHEVMSRPGMRVKIRGTIDKDDSIASVSGFGGSSEIFDNRNRLDDGVLDGMLSSKMR